MLRRRVARRRSVLKAQSSSSEMQRTREAVVAESEARNLRYDGVKIWRRALLWEREPGAAGGMVILPTLSCVLSLGLRRMRVTLKPGWDDACWGLWKPAGMFATSESRP